LRFRWYSGLTTRTRLALGVGIMAYAGFGLLASDQAEKSFGLTPTEEDKQRLKEQMPKLRMVDKDS